MGGDLLHPRILNGELFAEQGDLLAQPVVALLQPDRALRLFEATLRAWVIENWAREMVWRIAERIRPGQPVGNGSRRRRSAVSSIAASAQDHLENPCRG